MPRSRYSQSAMRVSLGDGRVETSCVSARHSSHAETAASGQMREVTYNNWLRLRKAALRIRRFTFVSVLAWIAWSACVPASLMDLILLLGICVVFLAGIIIEIRADAVDPR